MKGTAIVLDTPQDRAFAAARLVDGRLEDLILGPKSGDHRPAAGSRTAAKVIRKLPKSGAFCELENGAEGYLRDARAVEVGQTRILEVQSLPEPGKAVTLTTRLLYRGPRVILTPGAPGVNVSKKIGNSRERERLAAAVEAALRQETAGTTTPGEVGAIVRTAARNEEAEALRREVTSLVADWRDETERAYRTGGATPAPTEPLPKGILAEWCDPRPASILASPSLFEWLSLDHPVEGPSRLWGEPRLLDVLRAEPSPFDALGIWDEIDRLRAPEVALGDASMVIEPTRALVAVDVNTGSDFSPAAGLKTNLAAARDLPRQLRLRGLGGKVLVDFAPMPKAQRRTLEEALAKSFRPDPIETALVGWTTLGLFEIQRKRERWPLTELL